LKDKINQFFLKVRFVSFALRYALFNGNRQFLLKFSFKISRLLPSQRSGYLTVRRRKTFFTEALAIPGLKSMIEVMDAATPLTNMRYTKNPEGAVLGYEHSMDNYWIYRNKNRTPIRGLYLASAWGSTGGGINPVMRGGQTTFKALMEDWGHKGG
jgi:phytoene dehydrogenase-like protein